MDVFVSYSRRNKPFVQKLVQALQEKGLEVWVDFEDIRPTSDWQAEIYAGIRASDNFLFVISPPAVTSTYTEREVIHAVDHSKKIVPILYQPISEEEYANMNQALAVHDWVYFDDESKFEDAFHRLWEGIRVDIDYLHGHTHFTEHAWEWAEGGYDRSFLVSGEDLGRAERLLAESAHKEPKLSAQVCEFIAASRRAVKRRRRVMMAAVIYGISVALLAILAFLAYRAAKDSRLAALDQAATANSVLLTVTVEHAEILARQATLDAALLSVTAGHQAVLDSMATSDADRAALLAGLSATPDPTPASTPMPQ